jgi:hypothetical protein
VTLIVDESHYPVVVVEVRDAITDADVDQLLADGSRWLARETEYATIYSAHKLSLPSARNLKRLAAWMKDNKAALDRWHRCAVYVTDSAMLRGFLRALFRLQPLHAVQHATVDLDEAFTFAHEVLGRGEQRG